MKHLQPVYRKVRLKHAPNMVKLNLIYMQNVM